MLETQINHVHSQKREIYSKSTILFQLQHEAAIKICSNCLLRLGDKQACFNLSTVLLQDASYTPG